MKYFIYRSKWRNHWYKLTTDDRRDELEKCHYEIKEVPKEVYLSTDI